MQNTLKVIPQVVFILILIVWTRTPSVAQEKIPYKNHNHFELSASGSSGKFSGALSWAHVNTLTKRIPKLKIGYGLRFTSFTAANKFYVTAPARYTSPAQNVFTIFSETIAQNIDTLATPTANTNSLNVAIYIEYAITKKFDLGFNIDVVGFSFGSEKEFNVLSSSFDANQSPVQKGSPTRHNLLLTSDNDIGSLNSEFFIRYWPKENFGLRLGFTFLFSEYRTSNELSFDNGRIVNDRYRYKAGMPMFGLTYKPFN
jgi:hypothetical protein